MNKIRRLWGFGWAGGAKKWRRCRLPGQLVDSDIDRLQPNGDRRGAHTVGRRAGEKIILDYRIDARLFLSCADRSVLSFFGNGAHFTLDASPTVSFEGLNKQVAYNSSSKPVAHR
jgi:hypothetical protein